MNYHTNKRGHRALSLLMAVMMILSLFSTTVLAAQPTAYRDPAEHWMSAGNRTSELDVNAVTTKESFPCYACGQTTSFTVWRTPEYTKDGKSSLTHNVLYSDGTSVDGQNTGSLLMGKPGVDSTYTGYHWTKSCCDVCGTLNGNTSTSLYGFGKNVYILYDCAVGFIEDLDDKITYEPADSTYHTKIVDGGDYCQFCFGTHHTHSSSLEKHSFNTKILPQLDKQRFAIVRKCGVCGYTETEYAAAKCVVANYYGKVDGQAHTLLISDLSESGVRTEIRYGDSANNCTQATPPSYTEEGQYTVYYQVTYTYENTEMTENGVAYVWLHDETAMDPAHGFPGYDPHDHDPNAPGNTVHHTINIGMDSPLHQYTFLDTVAPTCSTLGYDRYLCPICGAIELRNYVQAKEHTYQTVVIREADCEHEGKSLKICHSCGEVEEIITPKVEHHYTTTTIPATCTDPGYTVKECSVCGDRIITNITAVKGHTFISTVAAPTCTTGGHTHHVCKDCGESYLDSYTEALGHRWDDGTVIKTPPCTETGLIEYRCLNCGVTKLEELNGDGSHSGLSATVQVNNTVNAGHHYSSDVTQPTCDKMGYTTYTCVDCGDSYKGDYTDPTGHNYKTAVTKPTCTTLGYTTYTCASCGDSYKSDYVELLGHNYKAVVTAPTCTEGGYTTFTCSRCGDSYVANYTAALGHDWKKPVTLADSTCNSEGVLEYDCSRCDAHYHEAISAKGHNPGPAATCSTPQTCKDCGAILTPATEHSYKTVLTQPTCDKMGYTTYTCTSCENSYKGDYVEILGHDYKAVVTAPTCTEGGYTTFTCTRCGDSYVDDHTDPLGHDWKGPETLADSTCGSDGVKEYNCSRCDAHYHEAISAKGHKPGPAATCDNPQTCQDCGAVLAPATGHSYKKTVTKPTCTKMGYTTYTCSGCGDSYKSDYTELLGHNYEAVITAPTCTEGGFTTYTCSRCEDSYVSDETDPLGHDWDKGTKIADASCKSEGVLEHHCKRCEEKYLEAISAKGHNPGPAATCTDPQLCQDCGAVLNPPAGHDYKSEVTAPTCTEMGYTTYTCDKCGDSYKADYTNPTGHQYSDWIMDREPTMDEEGQRHQVCNNCGTVLVTEKLEKLYRIATTDSKGEAVVNGYLVIVTDTKTKDPISNATVLWNEDGTITVRLPDGRTLDYGKDTTVLVLVGEEKDPVRDLIIKITDNSGNYASDKTNDKGEVTLPGEDGRSGDEGSVTVGGKDADADPFTITVNVIDGKNNRPIDDAKVTIGKTGTITVVLPDGRDIDENNPIIIKVTDQNGKPITDRLVIIKGDKDKETGRTNEDGTLTVPEAEVTEVHGIYILGYPDGTFGPARQMTRAEAAAIFARLLAEKKDDAIPTTATTKFSDVSDNAWYSGYVKYLSNFGVIYGTGEDTFAPNRAITRAEFVAMAVRFFDNYGDGNAEIMEQYVDFSDVSSGYWAAKYIKDAAIHGWIKGYEDGTFRADRNIARCEVVTIVNRLLDRVADQAYVDNNLRSLNTFTDMKKDHWAYYDVMESANAHTAHLNEGETWSK